VVEARQEAAQLMRYPVILHLDRVLDYSDPPGSPSKMRVDSAVSGMPVGVEAWPVKHPFVWRLGVSDGGGSRRRAAARDRLGGRPRDGSPPHGGGAGGFGDGSYFQMPPPGRFGFCSSCGFVHPE
jgi:hypothetical protein